MCWRRIRGTTPHTNACFCSRADNVKVFDQLGNYIGPTIKIPVTPGHRIGTVQSTPDGTKVVISRRRRDVLV